MFKLYKRGPNGTITHYHEVWAEPSRRRIIQHWGQIGEAGETKTHGAKLFGSLERQIDDILAGPQSEGYTPLRREDESLLTIEYPENEDGNFAQKAEDRIHEILGWMGLGYVEDSAESADVLSIACFVIDTELAISVLQDALKDGDFASYTAMRPE